jgi:hypothetical protein
MGDRLSDLALLLIGGSLSMVGGAIVQWVSNSLAMKRDEAERVFRREQAEAERVFHKAQTGHEATIRLLEWVLREMSDAGSTIIALYGQLAANNMVVPEPSEEWKFNFDIAKSRFSSALNAVADDPSIEELQSKGVTFETDQHGVTKSTNLGTYIISVVIPAQSRVRHLLYQARLGH